MMAKLSEKRQNVFGGDVNNQQGATTSVWAAGGSR